MKKEEAIKNLKKLINEDDTIYFIVKRVSNSGMYRHIDFYKFNVKDEFKEGEDRMMDLHNRSVKDESPCLVEPHHNNSALFNGYRIRRLTPIECERLQGFPDNHTEYGNYDGEVKKMSNTQRYKQCGNAVTVDVVQAVAEQLKPIYYA